MTYSSNGLTVGLAIGIPSFLIIVGVFLFWFRNHRKQKKEDTANSLDLELNDNQSFTEFGEQLHKAKLDDIEIKDQEVNGTTGSEVSGDTGASASASGGECEKITASVPQTPTRTPNIPGPVTPGTPGTPGHVTPLLGTPGTPNTSRFANRHSKSNSAYEFYQTFIPVLPGEIQQSQNSSISSIHHLKENDEEKGSLDNLAKQLNSQEFFGKIPPVTASIYSKNKSSLAHNSNDGLMQDAINDNYVYEVKY